jgi:uncharacterized protein YciI
MLFALYCVDKPNSLELRLKTRPTHIDYLKGFKDKIRLGGPLLADDGETPCGTLLIVELPDMAAAQSFSAGDPYAKAGLFGEVSIRPFRQVQL